MQTCTKIDIVPFHIKKHTHICGEKTKKDLKFKRKSV